VKLSSFEALADALNESGVRYLVAGGLAVTEPFDFDTEHSEALTSPLNERLTIRFVSLPTLIR
jgi:hypothetical protein